ncbi:MAG: prepilin-type N-terminal cleavage/methylation domain-containing protein [Pikeienuella sp.]
MSGAEEKGFTLLELLVAITLALILLAAAPGLLNPGAGSLEKATGMVAAELRRARAAAMTRGEDAAVLFDADNGRLRDADGVETALPAGVSLSLRMAAEVREARGAPGVIFFPEGGSTGGIAILRRGEAVARVETRWLTGAVHVE